MAQILSCLIGDASAAKLCGVIDTGKREDLYTNVYKEMCSVLGSEGTIQREDVKQAIMTSLFGSEDVPVRVFKTNEVLNVFYQTMEKMLPYAWELNIAFLNMWDATVYSYDWILPDNFHVHIAVEGKIYEEVTFLEEKYSIPKKVNKPSKYGRSISANCCHSIEGLIVRELVRRCSYDPVQKDNAYLALFHYGKETALHEPEEQSDDLKMVITLWKHYKKTGFLSARIIDHITNETTRYVDRDVVVALIDSFPVKPFRVLTVHDCVRVLPSYGNDVRKQYNLLLQEIAKSNLLSCVVSQILKREVEIGKGDENMWQNIHVANYALS
jgi:hypothetical protein